MQGIRTTSWLTVAAVLSLIGCGHDSPPPAEYPPLEEPEPAVGAATEGDEEEEFEEEEPAPARPSVQVVRGERTPLEGRPPSIAIQAPRMNQTIRRGNVMLRVQLRNWTLAPDPGNHVHVIVDNHPYIAVRDVSRPIDLNKLVQDNLGTELAPGTHVVRVFPSRPQHESVKVGTPFAMVVFHVQEATQDFEFDPRAPLLTYSRPKGCNPIAQPVLLDFYLTNVSELSSEGTRVRYTIDGESGEITEWDPHYIQNLTEGEHTVRLELVGEDGETVPGPFNDTSRTITVAEHCPDAHGHSPQAEAETQPEPSEATSAAPTEGAKAPATSQVEKK